VTAAFALLGYAIAAAWCAPALLAPLTSRGASVRPALAAWFSAMASVLMSAALGAALITQTAVADWPTLARVLCRGVAGTACTPQVYRSALYSAGVAILTVLITLAALMALWRYGRRTRRAVTKTRLHARAALLAGRELAGTGAVVLDDPRPVAYCVAGRPAAIVVTSGAVAVLDKAQLAAVLAHERAHLAELAADDMAARSTGRHALVAALLAIATGTAVSGISLPRTAPIARGALTAASYAVPARVERLLHPPRSGAVAMFGLVLALVSAVFILLPAALAAVAG
jgi:Zn-dependent protease with chaperone function